MEVTRVIPKEDSTYPYFLYELFIRYLFVSAIFMIVYLVVGLCIKRFEGSQGQGQRGGSRGEEKKSSVLAVHAFFSLGTMVLICIPSFFFLCYSVIGVGGQEEASIRTLSTQVKFSVCIPLVALLFWTLVLMIWMFNDHLRKEEQDEAKPIKELTGGSTHHSKEYSVMVCVDHEEEYMARG